METRITKLLGIKYPVIQGGMAWVATHELASAVSNAGGLGIIGAGGAEGAIDASNILKPALARGEVQVIGATTIEEYANISKKMPLWNAGSSRLLWRNRRRRKPFPY